MNTQTQTGNAFQFLNKSFQDMTDEMQICIQNCMLCHQICVHTLSYCLSNGDASEEDHIKTLMDCAQICTLSADFLSRESTMHFSTCGLCAEACLTAAGVCDEFADDEVMQACADTCRRCEESCRKMAAMKH